MGRQVVCRLYYDTDPLANGTIYALVEDNTYGSVEYQDSLYRFTNVIPDNTYKMEGFVCVNDKIKTQVNYENNKIQVITEKPNICYVYFKGV